MNKIILATILLTSFGQTIRAENYFVADGQLNGFSVSADNDGVSLTSPSGEKKPLCEPFVSTDIRNAPTGPIQCSWSPDGDLLAIFIPHTRMSDIHVVNLKTGRQLKQEYPKINWPDWYTNVYSAISHPKSWKHEETGIETLNVDTNVTLRDGTQHSLLETLQTTRNTFSVTPE